MDERESLRRGGPLRFLRERVATREVGIDGERGELDRQREALYLEIHRLHERCREGLRELERGRWESDDHLTVAALRRLLALGLTAKPLADQLEALLPQTTRLFNPGQ